MEKEIWKGVIYNGINYGKYYEASNLGKIRNTKTKNKFHNFHQREYSPEYYEQLERKLLAKTV